MWVAIRLNDEQGPWEAMETVPVSFNPEHQCYVFNDAAYGTHSYLTADDTPEQIDRSLAEGGEDTPGQRAYAEWEQLFLSQVARVDGTDDVVTFQFRGDTFAIKSVDDPLAT